MADGRLVRVKLAFERDFTQIPNEWLRDRNLSLKARGLLALLMSHDAGFVVTHKTLAATNPEGYSAIQGAVKELQLGGYLAVEKERGRNGRIDGWVWKLTDPKDVKRRWQPQLDYPDVDNPDLDAPDVDNQRLKEAHSEEQLNQVLNAGDGTGAGANEDSLPRAAVESHDDHVETPAERYERLVHQNCPMRPGRQHRRTGPGRQCAWCGIRPDQYWLGTTIVTLDELVSA